MEFDLCSNYSNLSMPYSDIKAGSKAILSTIKLEVPFRHFSR